MGIGIIDVLLIHYFNLTDIDYSTGWLHVVSKFPKLVYTPGFLFLSGFGIYMSLKKNTDIVSFYKRRVLRLFLPFLLIGIPFFTIEAVIDDISLLRYIGNITTFSFWYDGNYMAMWYIAITIVLYIVSPLLFRYTFSYLKFGGVIGLILFFNVALHTYFPNYASDVNIALCHSPMFVIGMLMGKSLYEEKRNYSIFTLVIPSCLMICFSKMGLTPSYLSIDAMCLKILFMIVLCYMFEYIDKYASDTFFHYVLKWLGRYSLEIYLLHVLIYFAVCRPLFTGFYTENVLILISIVLSLLLCSPVHKFTTICTEKLCVVYSLL